MRIISQWKEWVNEDEALSFAVSVVFHMLILVLAIIPAVSANSGSGGAGSQVKLRLAGDKGWEIRDEGKREAVAPQPEIPAPKQESVGRKEKSVKREAKEAVRVERRQTKDEWRKGEGVESQDEERVGGNDAADGGEAAAMTRYERLLSSWFELHKRYPDYARQNGLEGRAMLRIWIDRRGNIKNHEFDSTGYEALDEAVQDMVRTANPVPPVPASYPRGETLKFQLEIKFKLR